MKQKKSFKYIYAGLFFLVLLSALYYQENIQTQKKVFLLALQEAKGNFDKDLIYRRWASMHGGVYVPIDSITPPNPYLNHIPDRDIQTTTGKKLTLMNPAYMTRQVHEISFSLYGIKGHITSLKPLRPENKADKWEVIALQNFENGLNEFAEIANIDSISYFRFMKPLRAEKNCLKCHAVQGYKEGEIRGGLSVSLKWEPFQEIINLESKARLMEYLIVFACLIAGLSLTYFLSQRSYKKQKKVENLLRLTQYSINNSKDYIYWIDEFGNIIYVNQTLCDHLGYSRDEITKLKIFDIDPMFNLENWKNHWKEIIEKNSMTFETIHFSKDGNEIPVEVKTNSIEFEDIMYNYSIARDISIRQSIETALKNSEEKFSKAFKSIPEAISIANIETGEYIDVNDSFLKISGFNRDEVIGKTSKDLNFWINPDDRIKYMNEFKNKGYLNNYYIKFRMKNNEIRDFLVSSENIIISGILCSLNFNLDITQQKKDEELLVKQNMELERQYEEFVHLNEILKITNYDLEIAKSKAEESDKLKTAFLQNMSHEIRTPLNGILGFSELIQNENLCKSDLYDYTKVIKQSGLRLLEIVNNVIDISKIETGQIEISSRAFSINKLLRDLYNFYKSDSDLLNLSFDYHTFLDDGNAIIEADESKINKILSNLINNSLKFTTNGGIDIGYIIKNNNIEFYVRDTGCGIPDDMVHRIFMRFTQVNLSINRGYEGAGLGLAICQGLASALGGKIWFESEINKGTTFFVSIPYKANDQKVQLQNIKKSEKKDFTILLAEDDYTSYLFLSTILKEENFNILYAEDGQKAIDLVKKHSNINLILMDIRMPIVDGFEATKQIKEINHSIPIIAQTAYAFSEEKDEILASGFDDYISKPLDFKELISIIHKFIN